MNWLDIVMLVCVLSGIVKGLFDGLIKQVVSLAALALAIVLSGTVATWIRNFVQTHFEISDSISPEVLNIIYYILAFIVIFSLLAWLAAVGTKLINYTPLGIINKLSGAIIGGFLWALCLSILLNLISVFDKQNALISKQTQEKSVYYERVKTVFPFIYPYIKEYIKH